jgi:pimeloyl-ACP methyl ester carboxylesterase
MSTLSYRFDEAELELELTEGDAKKPLVVLLHGAGGDKRHMTAPAEAPDHNHDHRSPLSDDVTIGFRAYPGVGVWSCCHLDPMKDVGSWQAALSAHQFRTAVYSQVDPLGFLAAPVEELAAVMNTLYESVEGSFVLLCHSRGGLLARKFLKDFPHLTERICKLITLHSPHTGSNIANISVFLSDQIRALEQIVGESAVAALQWLLEMSEWDAFRELTVGGDFLADLEDGEEPVPWVDYFTFGGVSVRLTRIRSWVYTLGSAVPQWHIPPFEHTRTEIEVPGVSPVADSLPNVIEELSNGRGDLLTADSRTRLPFATHQTNPISHPEALWDPIIVAQVLRILGVDVRVPEPVEPVFWW